jgi:hypothetical protein
MGGDYGSGRLPRENKPMKPFRRRVRATMVYSGRTAHRASQPKAVTASTPKTRMSVTSRLAVLADR